ncbi:MAG: DUF1295 domain-containing protein [Planctomycetota bacterium]|nr:DUF1295 domain-containing protein [Planctomycetota bacterium]
MLSGWEQLGLITLGASLVMVALWVVQVRIRDAGVVDVGWAACLGLAAVFCALTGEGDVIRRAIIGVMGGVWGLRLALHLLLDRVLQGPEDGRYRMMREKFGARMNAVFFAFFLAQALLVGMLAPPFVLASLDGRAAPGVLDWAGLAVWVVGLVGETIADRQLKAFKARPDSRGKVCTVGLWRYSRHPNYFFEWIMWVGYAVVATGAPHGWIAWASPALMLLFVLKLTGIPPTEARAIRSRGEAYRAYQRTTSAFVPWFPKAPRDRAPETPS